MQTTKKRLQWHGLYCGGFYHGDCKRGNKQNLQGENLGQIEAAQG